MGSARPPGEQLPDFFRRLIDAAIEQTRRPVTYDGSYYRIAYPGGDVPAHLGVCTDVVIRAYRALGLDLQVEVHRDMARNFAAYPRKWGLKRPDPNIDHRRVPNLQTFFRRQGASLPVSERGDDYRPGDLVTWDLGGNLPHIGIVTDQRSADGQRPLIVHNIGAGPRVEDMLFTYQITGRFRWTGPRSVSGAGSLAGRPSSAPRGAVGVRGRPRSLPVAGIGEE